MKVETYYPEAVHPELIRATVFNRAIARENPWIKYLRENKVYDQFRELLQKARQNYNIQNPEKRAKSVAN